MLIKKVILRYLQQPLKVPFRTSFGSNEMKPCTIVELYDELGNKGAGVCPALFLPWYGEETALSAISILQNVLIPALWQAGEIADPEDFFDRTSWIKRNRIARSAVDCALWDLHSQRLGLPEYKALGGVKTEVEAGVSLGIEKTPADLLRTVEKYMKQGYRRIKIKIKPGYDLQYIQAVRKEFGDIMLMADANSAYRLKDLPLLQEIDKYNLLMIEQPLDSEDIVDHRHLQAVMQTPICLDESIYSLDDTRKAIELGSCRIINIKVARVGGLTEARRIQQYAGEHGVNCWCGGMLDDGIARAHNLAAASLPYYTYPNDIPGSDRYYAEDLVSPSTYIDERAMVHVPDRIGMGFEMQYDIIKKYTIDTWEYTRP